VPKRGQAPRRLDEPYNASSIAQQSERHEASDSKPVTLAPNNFVLAQTVERINLPIRPTRPIYAARIEGKSSRARLGMLVHFTAPTIHSGFEGHITLEIINLSLNSIELVPNAYICQIIFEEVSNEPAFIPSQFAKQRTPAGERP
jgi:dCTP deaminase